MSVSAKFQVQTLFCSPEISKCIGEELKGLPVKDLNSTITPELICAIYSTAVPFSELGRRNYCGRKPGSRRSMQDLICPAQCKTEPLKALDSRQKKTLNICVCSTPQCKEKEWMEDSGKVECNGKQKLVR